MRIPVRLPNNIDPRLSLRGEIARLQERLFWTPDGLQEYGELAQPVVLSGPFIIEILAYFGANDNNFETVISSDSRSMELRRQGATGTFSAASTGGFNYFVDDMPIVDRVTPIPVNRFARIRIERGTSTVSQSLTYLGCRSTDQGNTFGGVIANVRITDNGIPKHFWPLDRSDNLIEDKLNPAGAELVASGELGVASTSLSLNGNVATVVDLAAWGYVYNEFNTESGQVYHVAVKTNLSSGSFSLRAWDRYTGFTQLNIRSITPGINVTVMVFVATGVVTRIGMQRDSSVNGDTLTILSEIELRRATGWGEIKNPSANNKIKMRELEPRGDLRGDEQLPATMAHEVNWQASANAVITIEGETVTLTNTENSEAHAFVTIDSIPGMEYEILIPEHTHGLPAWTADSWSNSRSGFSGLTKPFVASSIGSSAQFRIGTNQGVAGSSVSFKGPVSIRPTMRVAK